MSKPPFPDRHPSTGSGCNQSTKIIFNFTYHLFQKSGLIDTNVICTMKGYMYILLCANGQYYTGSTKNLERRLAQHQNGEGANFTKKHLPVKLVYYEVYPRIDTAFYREKQVQGWSRKKKEALIKGNFNKLPELAKSTLRQAQGADDGEHPSTSSGCGRLRVAEPVEATIPRKAPFDKLRVRRLKGADDSGG